MSTLILRDDFTISSEVLLDITNIGKGASLLQNTVTVHQLSINVVMARDQQLQLSDQEMVTFLEDTIQTHGTVSNDIYKPIITYKIYLHV